MKALTLSMNNPLMRSEFDGIAGAMETAGGASLEGVGHGGELGSPTQPPALSSSSSRPCFLATLRRESHFPPPHPSAAVSSASPRAQSNGAGREMGPPQQEPNLLAFIFCRY